MTNNKRNSSIQVNSLSTHLLEDHISQKVSKDDLQKIRGGFSSPPPYPDPDTEPD